MKRVVVISDLHCGHVVGLTPPAYNPRVPTDHRHHKLYKLRKFCWEFYRDAIDSLQPIYLLIVNGDAVDGQGIKSGGTEQLTTDRTEQVNMAASVILYARAKNILMSYGTGYHTGKEEDWEDILAERVEAQKIGGHDWVEVNGLLIDYKHHVGRSSIPHGRFTPIAKERLWNILWSEYEEFPKSDIIIRSHVHKYAYCGECGWMACSTPALQAYGGKYGTRQCSGTVDFGLLCFEIKGKGDWKCQEYLHKFSGNAKKSIITLSANG